MAYGTQVDRTRKPSQRVIEAVADAEGIDPVDLDPVLNDAIDPGALDVLFSGENGGFRRAQFRYHGYDITVDRKGEVTLEEVDASDPSDPIRF